MRLSKIVPILAFLIALLTIRAVVAQNADVVTLPGTQPLMMEGDIASQLVAACDAFLLKQSAASGETRKKYWKRDLSSHEAYNTSIAPNRERLKEILGLKDARVPFDGLELITTTAAPALVGKGSGYDVFAVRWPAFGDVHGQGLLLEPTGREPIANVVALPHCDVTPRQLAGLAAGLPPNQQFAHRLAESGCRVVVPMLINRQVKVNGITNREWLHRSAWVMGRTMTGYEVQKTLAVVDWFEKDNDLPIGVIGQGDGGLMAMYAAAVNPQINAACISGAFGDMENLWQQPVDRMVFDVLTQFGDAELASMIAPRKLIIHSANTPEATRSGGAGAPYRIKTPADERVNAEITRARSLVAGLTDDKWLTSTDDGEAGTDQALERFIQSLSPSATLSDSAPNTRSLNEAFIDQAGQIHEIDRHTQALLRDSHRVRDATIFNRFDYASLEAYEKSAEPVRKFFYDDVIGHFDIPLAAPKPRTRLVEQNEKWKRYEVVLDVFGDVFAYGMLTVPNDIKDGERRPTVVCQHGLEGRPQSVIGEKDYHYYKAFATELAERGFVTFAPQNIYIFTDRFRTLQRKGNPLGKTLYSIMIPQHQQIVDWLQTQPFVDPDRVAFYGLSYGGKTAMRVPAVVTDYCLSICSADFNEWVDKNASTHNPRSYVNTGEYEIFEWNLGQTFNYAEMAALIAPRPFMVERGHHDGVSDDWTVAWEFSRVRFHYATRLKIPERTEIEWFDGPHSINGKGTYDFLHRHLNWPKPGDS